MPQKSNTTQQYVVALDHETKALEMRRNGAGYKEIAEELGMSLSGVHKATMRGLSKAHKLLAEEADKLRALETMRLDRMLDRVWPGVEAGDVKSIETALKISARRAKLYGLDAPEKVDVDVNATWAEVVLSMEAHKKAKAEGRDPDKEWVEGSVAEWPDGHRQYLGAAGENEDE